MLFLPLQKAWDTILVEPPVDLCSRWRDTVSQSTVHRGGSCLRLTVDREAQGLYDAQSHSPMLTVKQLTECELPSPSCGVKGQIRKWILPLQRCLKNEHPSNTYYRKWWQNKTATVQDVCGKVGNLFKSSQNLKTMFPPPYSLSHLQAASFVLRT